jgi:hypothetical protein
LIALYIDLRLYDKACTEGESMQTKREIAEELYEQYLSDEALTATSAAQMDMDQSYFPVSLDPNVKRLFSQKYNNLHENLNEYLFIEVYAFVLDKLRDYFTFFKSSQLFL